MKFNKLPIILTVLILILGTQYVISSYHKDQNKLVELSPRSCYLNSTILIKNKVKPHLENLILEAEKEGMCLIILSGYRTQERQRLIYNSAKDKSIVAYPGTSEHEEGIAVDFGGCPMINGVRNDDGQRLELRNDFKTLPEYNWLVENASLFGFVQSYTKENESKTGFPEEAWHWRFNQ